MTSKISNLKQKQAFLRVLVFSLLTVMIWVGFSLFRSQQRTVIPPELLQLAVPLNPNVDLDTVTRLEQKKTYLPSELTGFPVYRLVRDLNGGERLVTGTSSPLPSPTEQPLAPPVTQ